MKTSDIWMIGDLGMTRLIREHQVFTMRNEDGRFDLILAKNTDEFLAAGTREAVAGFFGKLKELFTLGKSIIEDRMKFNGRIIEIGPDRYVTLRMQ